jgi:fructokinase
MIIACGEALIDLFLYDRKGTHIKAEAVAGGSPFNVAIGLARLGQRVAFCGGLSTDSFGEFLSGILKAEGAVPTPRLSTVSVVSTDALGRARYSFHGEASADRGVTPADLDFALPADIEALTFGSYTLAVEPVASAYLSLMQREVGRRVISIDPNIRPTVIGDLTGYDRHLEKFLRHATIVKASEEDLELVFGPDPDVHAIAKEWMKLGASLIVVTRGAKGALAFHRDGCIDCPGRAIEVVDTVGAGDSFHAALLASLAAQHALTCAAIASLPRITLERALHYAVTASSITCGRRGADLPKRSEVDAAMTERAVS